MIYAKNKDAASYRGIHPNLDLALEQYAYCNDIVDQGVETVGRLADGLMKSHNWYFWWD